MPRNSPSDLHCKGDAYVPTLGFMDTIQLDTGALEFFEALTSEDLDPSLFESFGISSRT